MALEKLDRTTIVGDETSMTNKILYGFKGNKRFKVQRVGDLEFLTFWDHKLPIPKSVIEAAARKKAPKDANYFEISYYGDKRHDHSVHYFKKYGESRNN